MSEELIIALLIVGYVAVFAIGIIVAVAIINRIVSSATASGRFIANPDHEHLVSGIIFQLSAEGNSLMEQAFNTAHARVAEMKSMCNDPENTDWTIRTNADGKPEMYYCGKRVALISDIDDTLVDGAHYSCSIIGDKGEKNNSMFARFVMSEGCTALPGAVEFMNYAQSEGIEVYYVTNRFDQGYRKGTGDRTSSYSRTVDADGKGHYVAPDGREIGTSIYQVFGRSMYDISLESMKRLGFPIDDAHLIINDSILYGPSKERARQAIRNGDSAYPNGQRAGENASGCALTAAIEPHHVALLLGDQMTDFTDEFNTEGMDATSRAELVKLHESKYGNEWIILPNAVYGHAVEHGVKFGPKDLFRQFTSWDK